MENYNFEYNCEKEDRQRKEKALKESKKQNKELKEMTMTVTNVDDAYEAIMESFSFICGKKSIYVATEIINSAVVNGIDDAVFVYVGDFEDDRAEALSKKMKIKLINALRSSL